MRVIQRGTYRERPTRGGGRKRRAREREREREHNTQQRVEYWSDHNIDTT